MVLIYVLVVCMVATIVKDIFLLYNTFRFLRPGVNQERELPVVSVLVAARNEEATIERCLSSLSAQQYPSEKIEILVGNDASDDNTLKVARRFATTDSRIQVFDIDKLVVEDYGKMNVLVQLIQHAKGEVYLFTDADTQLNPEWTSCLVNVLQSGVGVVTGVSLMHALRPFEKFQYLDWLQAQAMVKVLEDRGTRVTSLGNNMGVTKAAYESVGGFHGVPFSITEDYELYCAIIDKGYTPRHVYTPQALGFTLPMPSFGALLEQRKRWMFGVIKLPVPIIVFLLLNALFIPVLVLLTYQVPLVGLILGLTRLVVLLLFVEKLQRLLRSALSPFWLIPFEFYQSLINLSSLIYFLLPLDATWKGRKFR